MQYLCVWIFRKKSIIYTINIRFWCRKWLWNIFFVHPKTMTHHKKKNLSRTECEKSNKQRTERKQSEYMTIKMLNFMHKSLAHYITVNISNGQHNWLVNKFLARLIKMNDSHWQRRKIENLIPSTLVFGIAVSLPKFTTQSFFLFVRWIESIFQWKISVGNTLKTFEQIRRKWIVFVYI